MNQQDYEKTNPCADCHECTRIDRCKMVFAKQLTQTVEHLTPKDWRYSTSEVQEELKHSKRLKDNMILTPTQKEQLMTRIKWLQSLDVYFKD